MSVEAECYVLKKTRDDLLVRSYNIPSGSGEGIDFLGGGVKIAVFCSLN